MFQQLRHLLRHSRQGDRDPTDARGEQFLDASPLTFTGYGGRVYEWQLRPALGSREETPPDIYVRAGPVAVAWIQNMRVHPSLKRATVGHLAVNPDLARKGYGRRVAGLLAAELNNRFGVAEIVFSENSTKYETAGYEAFFRSLGAVKLEAKPGWRPDWLWQFGTDVTAIRT